MWNSFWVEQLFGSSVRQLAVEGGREGGLLAGSLGSGLSQGISIFDLSSASFPSAFFVSCLAVNNSSNNNSNEVATTTVASFVYLCLPLSLLPLSLLSSRTMRTTIPLSARCQRRLSTFSDNQQGLREGDRGRGRGGGERECTEDLGHAIACATMQLTGDRSRRGAALPSASVARSGWAGVREREGGSTRGQAERGTEAARLTLILIPATDLPACLPPTVAAKSDRATCVRCSWQFCFALQSLKWVGKRNRNRRRNSKRKSNRNIRNAEGSHWGDLCVPISQANSLTYNLFLKQLMRRVKKGLRVSIPIKREFSVLRYSD